MSSPLHCIIRAAGAGLLIAAPAVAEEQAEPLPGPPEAAQCMACHGVRGETATPGIPDLGGQNAAYLETQLTHFKTGERFSPIMSPIAESLSDEEISELARYFSSVGEVPERQ